MWIIRWHTLNGELLKFSANNSRKEWKMTTSVSPISAIFSLRLFFFLGLKLRACVVKAGQDKVNACVSKHVRWPFQGLWSAAFSIGCRRLKEKQKEERSLHWTYRQVLEEPCPHNVGRHFREDAPFFIPLLLLVGVVVISCAGWRHTVVQPVTCQNTHRIHTGSQRMVSSWSVTETQKKAVLFFFFLPKLGNRVSWQQ